jgi:hypothetical protein
MSPATSAADAVEETAITAEVINKDESDFMKRLLKVGKGRGKGNGKEISEVVNGSKMHHICDGSPCSVCEVC